MREHDGQEPDHELQLEPDHGRREHGLVGRTAELARLRKVLTDPHTRAAVVSGPAGVGKSRLAEEVAGAAVAAGWEVVRARGSRSAATIPLGAFAHVLPPTSTPALDRTELLRATLARFTEMAGQRRVLALIDDAHHLDDASATLTELLVRSEIRAVVLVRAGEPLTDPIATLWITAGVERLELRPLARDEADALAEVVLDGRVSRTTLAELWRLTHGNALLAVEAVRAATDAGILVRQHGLWTHLGAFGSVAGIGTLVDSRVGALPEPERQALELLAVGEPVPLAVFERAAAGLASASSGTADLLVRLEQRGLVVVGEDERAEVRTHHPLYAEVLRDRMPRMRARIAARRLAHAAAEVGSQRPEDVLRVAVWHLEGGAQPDPGQLLDAARYAAALFDHALAERLACAARDALGDRQTTSDAQVLAFEADLLTAQAIAGQGRGEEAEQVFAALSDLARTGEQVARVTVPRAWNLATACQDGSRAIEVLRGSVLRIPEPVVQASLIGTESTLLSFLGDLPAARDATQRVLDRDVPDPVRLDALTIRTVTDALLGSPAEALVRVDEGLEIVDRLPPEQTPPLARVKLQICRVLACALEADLIEAERLARTCYLEAVESGLPQVAGAFAPNLGIALLARGRVEEARQVATEATEMLLESDPLGLEPGRVAMGALALAQSPDLRAAEQAVREHDARYDQPHRFLAFRDRAEAWVLARRGRLRDATDRLVHTVEVSCTAGLRAWAMWALQDLVRIGAAEEARPLLEQLCAAGVGRFGDLVRDHAVAASKGDARALADVATRYLDAGADLPAAEAQLQAARAHDQAGQVEQARHARRAAQRAGRGCRGACTVLWGTPGRELTARQRQVAHLAAEGHTNREIAAQLKVSVRTVDNHLAEVYARLGLRSRRELGATLDPIDPAST